MRPRPLHSRADLIDAVRDHTPTQACYRSLCAGNVSVLGGFTPAEGFPQYVVQIVSDRVPGKRWWIAVEIDEPKHTFRVKWLDTLHWKDWDGFRPGRSALQNGDDPHTYNEYRDQEKVECLRN